MDKVIDEGERILILPGNGIEGFVVLDEANLSTPPLMEKTGALRGDLDCLMHPVASTSSRNASISICSIRVISQPLWNPGEGSHSSSMAWFHLWRSGRELKVVSLKTLVYACKDVGTISWKYFGFGFLVEASARHPDTVLEAQTK
jgi:hypothetical protein